MPRPLLIVSQSDFLIQVVDANSHTEWQTVQIQISWLLKKPADLDLHFLQRQGLSGTSRARVYIKICVQGICRQPRLRSACTFTQYGQGLCCPLTEPMIGYCRIFGCTSKALNPSPAEHDMPCLSKQCRSRSVGFWRSQLIWICTVCH